MKQTIKITPPRGYRWVRVGEIFKPTDLWATEPVFDGRRYAAVEIEWLPLKNWICTGEKNNEFQAFIRKESDHAK